MLQWVVAPLAVTSISTNACGLVHWNSVTVPSSVMTLRWSNIAKLWCASAGAATSSAAPAARASLFVIGHSLDRALSALLGGFAAEVRARQVGVVLQDAVGLV